MSTDLISDVMESGWQKPDKRDDMNERPYVETQTVRQLFSEMEAYARQRDEFLRNVWEVDRKIIEVKAQICEFIGRAVNVETEPKTVNVCPHIPSCNSNCESLTTPKPYPSEV